MADTLGLLGATAARLGEGDRALEHDAWLEAREAEQQFSLGTPTRWRAAIAAELDDPDGAVRLLREAHGLGVGYGTLRTDPWYANLQGYAPFERFMEPRS